MFMVLAIGIRQFSPKNLVSQDNDMLDFRFPTAMQIVFSVALAEKAGIRSTSACRCGDCGQLFTR